MEYSPLKPIGIYLYEGSLNDSKLFLKITENLKRRRILRKGGKIDIDFCAQKNYWKSIMHHNVLPFLREILTLKGLRCDLLTPLKPLRIKRLYDRLFTSFKSFLSSWKEFKAVRSVVEDLFKVLKNSLSLKNLHRYSNRSVAKFIAMLSFY